MYSGTVTMRPARAHRGELGGAEVDTGVDTQAHGTGSEQELRLPVAEAVFGKLRNNKRRHRFTLRGRARVDGQWKRYCLVHNIEKLAYHIYA